jgi:hypothetical protein
LNILASRVHELLTDEYDLGVGEHAPSAGCINRVNSLLYDAFERLKVPLPLGFASTTGYGDVRLYWRSESRSLHLVFPPNDAERFRLYYRDGQKEVCEKQVSPATLADYLGRFGGV